MKKRLPWDDIFLGEWAAREREREALRKNLREREIERAPVCCILRLASSQNQNNNNKAMFIPGLR